MPSVTSQSFRVHLLHRIRFKKNLPPPSFLLHLFSVFHPTGNVVGDDDTYASTDENAHNPMTELEARYRC